MKTRMMWTVLIAVTVLWGCESWRERMNRPVEPKASSPAVLKQHAARAQPDRVTTVTAAATTPRGAYEMYRQAIIERKFDRCWPLLSASTQDRCNEAAGEFKRDLLNNPNPRPRDLEILYNVGLTRKDVHKLDGRRFLIGSYTLRDQKDPHAFDPITKARYDHEAIRGDRAEVFVRIGGRRQDEPMRLVREGGVWRIEPRTTVSMPH